ncbi:HSP20 family protein [Catalinimonas alkaloidigena]|uniref:Hsp20/alpha crystallin family protein n=1 Tax=Catalinimonas alkaloidigena TaxID=1075417 RepID=UPI00240666DE|nr:Hsp20/alpha crystallin family protein [Catalinimonas alkaloidigena]MDF9795880.1 HSP20 family protein [Catalinimonas alkaloidigena]
MMKNVLKDFVHQFDAMNTIGGGSTAASVNIDRQKDHFTIVIHAPSVSSDAFNIFLRGNQLVVYAVLKGSELFEDDIQKAARYTVPVFNQTFEIPPFVDKEQIDAIFDKGLLKVHMPYNGEQDTMKVKKIDIREY